MERGPSRVKTSPSSVHVSICARGGRVVSPLPGAVTADQLNCVDLIPARHLPRVEVHPDASHNDSWPNVENLVSRSGQEWFIPLPQDDFGTRLGPPRDLHYRARIVSFPDVHLRDFNSCLLYTSDAADERAS